MRTSLALGIVLLCGCNWPRLCIMGPCGDLGPASADAATPDLAGDAAAPDLAGDAAAPDLAGDAATPDLAGDAATPDLAGDAATCVMGPCNGMVSIPAGTFMMGTSDISTPSEYKPLPVHRQSVSAFLLDQTEVTVAAYQAYCTAKGNCAQVGTASGCNFGVPGREQHPINCVTWDQAVAYCDSLGKRLPTEIEWEYAARGPLSPEYPWGATAPTTDLCWNRTSTCEVGQFSSTLLGAVVADGLYDMGGNVYEWTSSHLCPYPISDPNCDPGAAACTWPDAQTGMVMYMGPCRINRGGSYRVTNAKYVHAGYRDPDPVAHQSPGVGFRCAQ